MAQDVRPTRGTRPRNRRALVLEAASGLFASHGYPHVAMSDISEAVGIGPSALYRHFSGKQQILSEVVHEAFASMRSAADTDDLGQMLKCLAGGVLDRREIGVLWQRESRHLESTVRQALRLQLITAARQLAELYQAERPELAAGQPNLLAWATMGALMSVSYQHVELPRDEYEALLAEMAGEVFRTELPAPPGETMSAPTRGTTVTGPQCTRDRLLAAAIRLFAERGFQNVGIEDIGAAVGIAGPGIYHHFPSKADMLLEAMDEGADQLNAELARASREAVDRADVLRRLLRSYVEFALADTHIVDLLITEAGHVPEADRPRLRKPQRAYIAEWVRLLTEVHPTLEPRPARVRAQAVLTVANDVARTPRLRTLPGIEDAVCAIGESLLLVTQNG
jgi:AcrR family transcriptional regulator